MAILTKQFNVSTKGYTDIIDITKKVNSIVSPTAIKEGQVLIFVKGSTASISTIEYEPGLLQDLPEAFERIAPSDIHYKHDETWGDGNGMAHVRSSIVGCSIMVPLIAGVLELGTWQQIILIDFDNKARNRTITVQISY